MNLEAYLRGPFAPEVRQAGDLKKTLWKLAVNAHLLPFQTAIGLVGVLGCKPQVIISNLNEFNRFIRLGSETPYARRMTKIFKQAPYGSVFLNVGSAEGLYSLLAAKSLAGGHVYALEPDPRIYERLLLNIKLNHLERTITSLNLAASDTLGAKWLHSDGNEGLAPSFYAHPKINHGLPVHTYPIDYLIEQKVIQPPDIITIDVEGYEGPVLSGMAGLLASSKKPAHLFIEYHPDTWMPQGYSQASLDQQLLACGYHPSSCFARKPQPLIHYTAKLSVGY